LFGGFSRVDEACGDFDGDFVNWRAVLLLEDDFAARGLVEDSDDADAVNVCVFGTGSAFGGFPCSSDAVGVLVCDPEDEKE
jgi:hypothetical protein